MARVGENIANLEKLPVRKKTELLAFRLYEQRARLAPLGDNKYTSFNSEPAETLRITDWKEAARRVKKGEFTLTLKALDEEENRLVREHEEKEELADRLRRRRVLLNSKGHPVFKELVATHTEGFLRSTDRVLAEQLIRSGYKQIAIKELEREIELVNSPNFTGDFEDF